MRRGVEDAIPLLHNSGYGSGASVVWRGIGRGPLNDDAERIEVARHRGTWLHLSLSIGQADARYQRDWNTAGALLKLLEPDHGLAEAAATSRLVERIEAHCTALDWPECLMVGKPGRGGERRITLDHAPTTFVALAKSTGSLWMRSRAPRLAPLHAAHLIEPGSVPMRGVRWDQHLWFPNGIPDALLSQAAAQLPQAKTARPNPIN